MCNMKHVFIIGSRGLPAKYGGFETFVDELVSNQQNKNIKYHVANLSDDSSFTRFDYKGADVFNIKTRNIGAARVILYDMDAINYCLKYVEEEKIEKPIFYILGNTIGAFIGRYAKKIHKAGGLLLVNPDGLEWRRSKWIKPIQKYLKLSEKKMIEHADLIIADNGGIEEYLLDEYKDYSFESKVIAYGTDICDTNISTSPWFEQQDIIPEEYYLVVGRFVPENNYETIIKSFMASNTSRDLVIVTDYSESNFLENLKKNTNFTSDDRIKFVGTVYDKNLLKLIRTNAYGYIHGHEVGGTNPGLLEAMWSTDLNLVLDVNFNKKVCKDNALYWNKKSLTELIEKADLLPYDYIENLGMNARQRILDHYTWEKIVSEYEELFIHED